MKMISYCGSLLMPMAPPSLRIQFPAEVVLGIIFLVCGGNQKRALLYVHNNTLMTPSGVVPSHINSHITHSTNPLE